MRKYQIKWQAKTQEDIENLVRYKGRFSSSAPSRIVAKIFDRLDDVASMPRSGRISEYDSDYRQVFIEDYTVFYLVDDEKEVIEVHYVLHQSRNIEKILRTGDRSFTADIDPDEEDE
jgi:plasmid stabilization system protein ParE